jgi:MFS superfamily sulfate permease-like transporter
MESKPAFLSNIHKDFLSGLIVFLIALPLCLGIAQASHAPLFAGLVAGIVGGIVVGFVSRSQLSVTGPAAGLTAIVYGALNEMSTFEIFLCSVIIAGAVQLLMGFLKAGSIANYIPSSVIEGMLAGIGLTIIIKQLPEAVGYDKDKGISMTDADDGFIAGYIGQAFSHIQPAAVIIAITGVLLLILWQAKAFKKIHWLPASLIAVISGVIINELLIAKGSGLALDSTHLVSLPVATSAGEFAKQFSFPDLHGFALPEVWKTGFVIAIVASIESLLCIEATDKLDPHKRYTPASHELKAQGIGNIISGFIGGLPVTSVIVRSSANINAGARSKMSTIVHGVLLLVCVATIPFILNKIPKAGLAAILIFTGYRLCRPAMFKHMWKEGGMGHFVPFLATCIGVVSLDLLKGVSIGLVLSVIYMLRHNMRQPFVYQRSIFSTGELIKLTLAQEVYFMNKANIKATLEHLPAHSRVIIDASHTRYIDFDVLDLIKEFHDSKAVDRHIQVSLIGFKNRYKIGNTNTEQELFSPMLHNNEVPKRSSGGYKKLLKHLINNSLHPAKTKVNVS